MWDKMNFLPLSVHANLILNRLRNERRVADDNRENDQDGGKRDREEERARTDLALVKRRLADLAEFERRARGKKD